MPIALILDIIQAAMALAPEVPQIVSLLENATGILKTGTVTPEQEAAIRAQLDAVTKQIDAM